MKKLLLLSCIFIACNGKTRVVVKDFVTITNHEKGLGLYSGEKENGERILFTDRVCMLGIGDTIEIADEQIEGTHYILSPQ